MGFGSFLGLAKAALPLASSFVGGGRKGGGNPADAAMPYMQGSSEEAKKWLMPYVSMGESNQALAKSEWDKLNNMYSNEHRDLYAGMPNAYDKYKDLYADAPYKSQYEGMGQDPIEFIDRIMKGYQPSKGYSLKEKRALGAQRNSAASGGFAGTQFDQENQAQTAKDLMGEDIQQYLSNILGVQNQGLEGMERLLGGRDRAQSEQIGANERYIGNQLAGQERAQNERFGGRERAGAGQANHYENSADRSFRAAEQLAQILAGNQNQMAGAAFQGSRQNNANQQTQRGNVISGISDLLGGIQGMNQGTSQRQQPNRFRRF